MSRPTTTTRAGQQPRRRRLAPALAAVLALATLAACGGGGGGDANAAPENPIVEGEAPTYYPAEYSQTVEASKTEGGELVIYSNTDQENWAPIFRDLQKKVPSAEAEELLTISS